MQAVYAVASDRTDRFADVAPLIATWAGQMDTVVNHSAGETGGERHIRFVTTPGCALDVAHVVLSPTGDDSLSNTINELRTAWASDRTDRKYVIWADAAVYCGIGAGRRRRRRQASRTARTRAPLRPSSTADAGRGRTTSRRCTS